MILNCNDSDALVWLDLWLNTSLPDRWRALYSLGQYPSKNEGREYDTKLHWQWFSCLGDLVSVKYPFIAITFRY